MSRIYLRMPVQNVAVVEKIVTVYYFEYRKDYRSKGESHDFWEINYVDRGSVVVTCGEEEHTLSKGDLILLPPDRHHTLRADGEKPSSVFIISFEAVSEFLDHMGCRVFTLNQTADNMLNDLVRECRQTYNLPMENLQTMCLSAQKDALPGSQQMVRIRLEMLLIELIRQAMEDHPSSSAQLVSAKTRLEDDIAARIMDILTASLYSQLTLEAIAKKLGYGKTYIASVFRKVYGASIMAYYTQLKIDEAKRMIHDGDLTITELSDKLCFSTPQYFTKCFTRHVGMSPREFKHSINKTWSTVKKR